MKAEIDCDAAFKLLMSGGLVLFEQDVSNLRALTSCVLKKASICFDFEVMLVTGAPWLQSM